jgi:hypothetical protein
MELQEEVELSLALAAQQNVHILTSHMMCNANSTNTTPLCNYYSAHYLSTNKLPENFALEFTLEL